MENAGAPHLQHPGLIAHRRNFGTAACRLSVQTWLQITLELMRMASDLLIIEGYSATGTILDLSVSNSGAGQRCTPTALSPKCDTRRHDGGSRVMHTLDRDVGARWTSVRKVLAVGRFEKRFTRRQAASVSWLRGETGGGVKVVGVGVLFLVDLRCDAVVSSRR
ncbi:hypothetical protein CB0940_12224 [Cercospora beticola]|uniref:Uncharacterized protein n=1 Tax=Cercospora beticola TaxID=122368 RepID=A0A2G5GKR2_CERBT|nr:hypothetical protein CB0940_12224 [Cercospora beticola]PIA80867.1 hypothetical protein CB0940_12224 [Cercospora beticola]